MKKLSGRGRLSLALLALLTLAAALGGCARQAGTAVDEDFLGVDRTKGEDQVVITVTASACLDHFAAAVEARFPDIRLVQDSYMGELRINEHVARVNNGDWGDLVMIIAGLIPKADMTGLLMDLSTQPFPAQYNADALQMDDEGHIYLLPGPLNFNCNIYNKTLFDENGWSIPASYEELLTLCAAIGESGIRAYQYILHDTSIQSYQIYHYCVLSALDTLTQVEGQTWHNQLTAGKPVSLEPMGRSFENLRRLIDAGMVREEDLEVTGSIRYERMASRQAAITPGPVSLLHQLNDEGTDEYRFMPHFSMTDGRGWLLSLGYYFGANQTLRQPGNERKREAAMKILSFIATEEGQEALIADDLGMIPATRGAKLPDDPVFDGIRAQVESGHYVMRPTYDMFIPVLETEIAAFIRGETTGEAVLEKCDALLARGAPEKPSLGQASSDFTVLQTGNLKADALRSAAGADIALMGMAEADCYVPVGGTRAKLYAGGITQDDVARISQSLVGEAPVCRRASVTGANLLALLERGACSQEELAAGGADRFHPFAVSGLTLRYDLNAGAGARVADVRLAKGGAVDPDALYTVAFLEGALPEELLSGVERTQATMNDAFSDYVTQMKTVTPDKGRIRFQ